MTDNQQKYPWLKIVQFHKDFVKLEQDTFFKIRLGYNGKPESSKAVEFGNYFPDSIDGAWNVPLGVYKDEVLVNHIKKGSITEGYIGGPCWIGKEKDSDSGKWVSYCSPLLYQHVRVEYDKDHQIIAFIPDEGRWEIPPVIYNQIEKKEFLLDIPLEELSFRILENAHLLREKNNRSLSENIVTETIARVPPLQDLFRTSNTAPEIIIKPWIFFIPPSMNNSYVRHLLPDYDTLEKRLIENPSDIGGLKILESPLQFDNSNESEKNIYPLIPLNSSQETAVSGILDQKPVTVISGPPGCGKSQVVVSLLLNAWAEGKSVLFVSNTQAAVDVVYDRLKEYECEYPIAVRAGKKERNTIDASLEKLKYLTTRKKTDPKKVATIHQEIAELSQKKKEYQHFLDEKIPQRITQAKQTASRSFLDFIAVSKEIASNTEQYQKQLRVLGYPGQTIQRFEEEVFLPLEKWWDAIDTCRNQIKNDERERDEYSRKISTLERERDRILNDLGYSSQGTSYSWLITGPSPVQFEQWLIKYRSLLSEDIEQYYSSNLSETHKKWNSESDARLWVSLSGELIHRVDNLVNTNKEKYSYYTDLKNRHVTLKGELNRAGLPLEVPFDKSRLVQWKQEYAHYLSIPDGILSFLKKRGADSSLRQIEREFQSYYSPEVWAEFSKEQKAGRKRLSSLIDLTLRWIDYLEEWQKFGADRIHIERECKEIEEIRKNLHLQKFIFNYRDDLSFIEIAHQIKGLEGTAREAADTWCLFAKKERLLTELRTLALHMDMLLLNSPIMKIWGEREGFEFAHILSEIKTQPTFDLIAKSWVFCSADRYLSFIEQWKTCQNVQRSIEEYKANYEKVPTVKLRISDWWAQKPQNCVIEKIDQSTLPHEGDVLQTHLLTCEQLNTQWLENKDTVLKELERQKKDHFNRAIQNLTVSYNTIPPAMRDTGITEMFRPILNQSTDDNRWINDDDEEIFNQFNPERIQAKITQINYRLARLSFSLAQEQYLKRIGEGTYILEDVDALRKHFRYNYKSARGFPREKYVNALKAVPIWVTNAHQPQSFPLEPEVFDILVIDEASQCTLTNILPLLYRAKSLTVIGDPNQLAAIFKDVSKGKELTLALKHGISENLDLLGHIDNTVFELGLKFLPGGRKNMINLVEHYRSHPLIIGFSNIYIYQMHLSLKKEAVRSKNHLNISGIFGVNIIGECTRGNNGKSWVNFKEAKLVCDIIRDLINSEEFMTKSIGVVTPFSSHKDKIIELLQEYGVPDVLVGTVDTFQGNERDIMLFSPVISKGMTPATACWSDNKNRINVALTRARDLLVVVGDFDQCRRMDTILGKLIDYIEVISSLRQTSMAELELFSLMIMEGNELKINMNNQPRIHQRIGRIEVDFVLHNPEKGVNLVIEVDGKQHYYVEVNGTKYSVKYEGFNRFIEIGNKRHSFHLVGKQEFVDVDGKTYPVIQTTESIQDDKGRDALLKSEGYKVHRIQARDIFEKPAVVIDDIKRKLEISES
jgi:superfamily I DNA and/or RNA helicase/very-short-patch-repair endonuclease